MNFWKSIKFGLRWKNLVTLPISQKNRTAETPNFKIIQNIATETTLGNIQCCKILLIKEKGQNAHRLERFFGNESWVNTKWFWAETKRQKHITLHSSCNLETTFFEFLEFLEFLFYIIMSPYGALYFCKILSESRLSWFYKSFDHW